MLRIISILVFALLASCMGQHFKPMQVVDRNVNGFIQHYDGSYFEVGEKGHFSVELITTEERLEAGNSRFQLVLHHATEGDTENAEIAMSATSRVTGRSVEPTIWEDRYGLYDVIGLNLDEPGLWDVDISVEKDGQADKITFALPGREVGN